MSRRLAFHVFLLCKTTALFDIYSSKMRSLERLFSLFDITMLFMCSTVGFIKHSKVTYGWLYYILLQAIRMSRCWVGLDDLSFCDWDTCPFADECEEKEND